MTVLRLFLGWLFLVVLVILVVAATLWWVQPYPEKTGTVGRCDLCHRSWEQVHPHCTYYWVGHDRRGVNVICQECWPKTEHVLRMKTYVAHRDPQGQEYYQRPDFPEMWQAAWRE